MNYYKYFALLGFAFAFTNFGVYYGKLVSTVLRSGDYSFVVFVKISAMYE